MHRWIYKKISWKYRWGKRMATEAIDKNVLKSINRFIEKIKKKYNVTAIILFG